MTTVVVAPSNVAGFPEGGGHFWVYMQYVQGLRSLGCDVYWLENFVGSDDAARDQECIDIFLRRMRQFGLAGKVIIHRTGMPFPPRVECEGVTVGGERAESICSRADLLLNFFYAIEPNLLSRFSTSALVDIDPGLLQFWISQGQICIPPHDYYLSTGETVGTSDALFPDCGIPWRRIRPVISLSDWPYTYQADARALTTISGWWGDEWISDGAEILYQNNKRVSFLQFGELAGKTNQAIELALALGLDNPGESSPVSSKSDSELPVDLEYQGDRSDREMLENLGWSVRLASEVASSPASYRDYIQSSRGEFSCAKPSCMKFQNAWVSDRSLCYLASGKPVIVQSTGRSAFLPNAEGMFRFDTIEGALAAIEEMNANYELHCHAARALAETHFDAERELASVLDAVL